MSSWRARGVAMAACAAIVCLGCGDREAARLAGMWQGGFEGEPKGANVKMRPEWNYRGNLALYLTGRKFKMHLETSAQIVDIEGRWKIQHEGKRLELTLDDLKFDDRGGALRRKPGVVPIDPAEVRRGYGRRLVFNVQEGPRLVGLRMSIGPIEGQHTFLKGQG